MLQNHLSWVEEESQRSTSQLSAVRQERAEEVGKLQSQLAMGEEELKTAAASGAHLKEEKAELERKMEDVMKQLREVGEMILWSVDIVDLTSANDSFCLCYYSNALQVHDWKISSTKKLLPKLNSLICTRCACVCARARVCVRVLRVLPLQSPYLFPCSHQAQTLSVVWTSCCMRWNTFRSCSRRLRRRRTLLQRSHVR